MDLTPEVLRDVIAKMIPEGVKPDDKRNSLQVARDEGVSSTSCARCHGANGFVAYAERLEAGNPVAFSSTELSALGITDGNVEPITCQACHNPHDATNPNQLRAYDEVALLPGGFGVAGVGKGALCMTCHNTRNGQHK